MKGLRIVAAIVEGVAVGIAYYLVFAVALPALVRMQPLSYWPYAIEPARAALYVSTLSTLSTVVRLLQGRAVAAPLAAVRNLLGFILLYDVLGGGTISYATSRGGVVIHLEVDLTPLLAVLLAATVAYSLTDVVASIRGSEE